MTMANLDLAEALTLTSDDIERMSTPDLLRLLEQLLSILPLSELERLRQFVPSLCDGGA